jgi:hypothetical protein
VKEVTVKKALEYSFNIGHSGKGKTMEGISSIVVRG